MAGTDKPDGHTSPLSNRGEVWDSIPPQAVLEFETGLTYWDPWFDGESMHSVDMVRLSFKLEPLDGDETGTHAAEWWYSQTSADKVEYWPSNRPNQYETVYTLYWGEWQDLGDRKRFDKDNAVSMTVGLGWIDAGSKRHPLQGFVELNPNKVGQFAKDELQAFLRRFAARFTLERWDYAMDVKEDRKRLLMAKDGRNYEAYVGRSVTTYLGKRNTPGRVKVYDKQAESKLPVPVTRIEVTYGRPTLNEDGALAWPTGSAWPLVGRAASTASAAAPTEVGNALIQALLQLFELGQDIVPLLQTIKDPKTRAKYRALLMSDTIEFNPAAWTWCAGSALKWEHPEQWW